MCNAEPLQHLETHNTPTRGALEAVYRERLRQDWLKAQGRFKYTCADSDMDEGARLAVLMEEVGEVAREVQEYYAPDSDYEKSLVRMRTELTQVAAVAVAWIESLDV